jgi:hypothetical protein
MKPCRSLPAAPRWCPPTHPLDVIKEDPDDKRVLECAVTAGSRFTVSGKNDLLRFGQFGQHPNRQVADFRQLITRLDFVRSFRPSIFLVPNYRDGDLLPRAFFNQALAESC